MYALSASIPAATRADSPPARRRREGAGWRAILALLGVLLALSAMDAAAANKKTRNALIGAGLGAAGGALLSHGDPWATVGGAAAGGLIGAVVTKNHHDRGRGRDHDRYRYNRGYRDDRGYRGYRDDRRGRWGR